MSLLSTRALTRHFSGLRAVENVDFDLPQGEVRALIGPNGAGKTTFVSLLCGRIPPTSGAVIFDGQDISALPAHRRINLGMAYTFQITSVFANLSVHENVALAARRRAANVDQAVTDARRDRRVAQRSVYRPRRKICHSRAARPRQEHVGHAELRALERAVSIVCVRIVG